MGKHEKERDTYDPCPALDDFGTAERRGPERRRKLVRKGTGLGQGQRHLRRHESR